jgi:hypothetical protein
MLLSCAIDYIEKFEKERDELSKGNEQLGGKMWRNISGRRAQDSEPAAGSGFQHGEVARWVIFFPFLSTASCPALPLRMIEPLALWSKGPGDMSLFTLSFSSAFATWQTSLSGADTGPVPPPYQPSRKTS